MKKCRGLTLISLVITVVVLLIIASVSIAMLTSDNGLLKIGQATKEETEISEEKNILKASAVSALGASSINGIEKENLEYYLDLNIGDEDYVLDEQDGQFIVTFIEQDEEARQLKSGRQYKILDDATILEADEENYILKLQPNSIPDLELGDRKEIKVVSNMDGEIVWSTTNPNVCVIEEDSVDNKKINLLGREIGTAQIIATVEQDGITKTAYCNVEVIPTEAIRVLTVEIDKPKDVIDMSSEEKTIQLNAIFNPTFANTGTELMWTSSDTNVATVDESGLVTGVSNGVTTITVRTSNDKTDSCDITVQTTPTALALDKTETIIDLSKSKEQKLIATIQPQEANFLNDITWTSSDTSIVTVNEQGVLTGIKNGSATITATTDNEKVAECKVVVQSSITEISLDKTKVTLKPSETTTIKATIQPNNLQLTENVKWTNSNSSVATISTSGEYNTICDVKTLTPGTITLTAQNESGTIKQTCTITILPTVSGTNQKYTLKAYYEDVYDYECWDSSYQTCEQVPHKSCILWIFCSTSYTTECTTHYDRDCGYEYAGRELRSGSTTINFQLSSYIDPSKLKLEKNGISQVNVGSIQVVDQTNAKYKINLSTSSTSFAAGNLSLKYVDGNNSIELYNWTISN